MPITIAQTVERVFYRLGLGVSESEAKVYRYQIESWIDDGLRRLGDMIADSGLDSHYLTKTFSTSLTAGIGALNAAINIRTIPTWGVVTGAGLDFPLQYVSTVQDLDLPKTTFFEYYCIHGGSSGGGAIHVRKGDGTATALSSVTIRCGFYPTISEVPDQLIDNFVDMMVEIGREKLGAGVAANG